MVTIPGLVTPRLALGAPTVDDFEGYASIVTGPRGHGVGGPFTREEAWLDYSQMVAGWVLRGYGALSVRTRGATDDLGTVLVHHEFGDSEPELGVLLTAEAEGLGIARAAAAAMLAWAWRATELLTLVSYVAPDNPRAHRLCEAPGGALTDGPPGLRTYRYRPPA